LIAEISGLDPAEAVDVYVSSVYGLCPICLVTQYKSLIFVSHFAIKKNQCNPSQSASSFLSLSLIGTSTSYGHKLGARFVCHWCICVPLCHNCYECYCFRVMAYCWGGPMLAV